MTIKQVIRLCDNATAAVTTAGRALKHLAPHYQPRRSHQLLVATPAADEPVIKIYTDAAVIACSQNLLGLGSHLLKFYAAYFSSFVLSSQPKIYQTTFCTAPSNYFAVVCVRYQKYIDTDQSRLWMRMVSRAGL